jgi:hypothetical protein
MNARLMMEERHVVAADAFVELVVWQVASPVAGSAHNFKYRLAFVVNGTCVLRYDNEMGKGDHKHVGDQEMPYTFTTPELLLQDFWNDVDNWRP